MALTIRKIADFDVNTLTFSAVRKNDKGGRAVYLNSAGGQKLLFQLPQMRAPFGLSEFTDKATGRTSYSLNLSLDDEKVRTVFQSIDDKILEFVVANSEACLGKKYSIDIMREALFKSAIKPGKDNYAPTLQLKVLPGRDGKGYAVEAYNSAKQPVELATLEKGQGIITIIEINQIWFVDNKFGVSIRLQQALFAPLNKLKGFSFVDVETTAPASTEEDEDDIDIPASGEDEDV
jgi:hypothetical protein